MKGREYKLPPSAKLWGCRFSSQRAVHRYRYLEPLRRPFIPCLPFPQSRNYCRSVSSYYASTTRHRKLSRDRETFVVQR